MRDLRAIRFVSVAVLLGAGQLCHAQADGVERWRLSGSYLSLYTRSRTVIPAPEPFTFDLNRLRLRLEGRPIAAVSFDVQYDNELLIGSYVNTLQFGLTEARVSTSFDLSRRYVTRRGVVARHGVYRAVAGWSGRNTDVTIGRQRIPFGTGYFWSPMDLLNPVDPARLDRDYRLGADAVLVERRLGAVARAEGIFAPATARMASVGAAYLHGNVRGADYSLLIGRFRGDDALGVDLSTSSGGLGIRAEATTTRTADARRYGRVVLGADYGFANSATVTFEAYYNGQGVSDPDRYDAAGVLEGRTLNVARWYSGVATSYQVTPLLKAALYGVLNVDDRSGLVWPRVEWSARSDLSLAAGLQRFIGGARTEYGRMSNLLHAEARWYF